MWCYCQKFIPWALQKCHERQRIAELLDGDTVSGVIREPELRWRGLSIRDIIEQLAELECDYIVYMGLLMC